MQKKIISYLHHAYSNRRAPINNIDKSIVIIGIGQLFDFIFCNKKDASSRSYIGTKKYIEKAQVQESLIINVIQQLHLPVEIAIWMEMSAFGSNHGDSDSFLSP